MVAVRFINDLIEKDDMLEQFYPDQMKAYRHAIEQTREQLLGQMTV